MRANGVETLASAGIFAASASSATSGALGTALNGGSFGDCLIAGTKGAIFGGMSAMAAVGIGDTFMEIGLLAKSKLLTEVVRAGTHSATQAAVAVLLGGDFWQGAASGALNSIGVSIYGGDNFWVTMAIGSASGGIGSVIGGAETAEEILFGMATGAIVGALNNYLHEAGEKRKEREIIKFFNRLRSHYEGKSGNEICLSRKELDYLISKGEIKWESSKYNESTKTFSAVIDFYNSDTDLKLSFGRATVYYMDKNGKAIFTGFHDVYDFDPKSWGTRSYTNEIITRTYNSYSSGKKFEINF